MKYVSFEAYWQAEMVGKFGTVPVMELAFKEIAEKAWNAALAKSTVTTYPNGEQFFDRPSGRIYGKDARKIQFKKTGEFRAPRKGEWYLSGAIPLAYFAPSDFDSVYYILVEA